MLGQHPEDEEMVFRSHFDAERSFGDGVSEADEIPLDVVVVVVVVVGRSRSVCRVASRLRLSLHEE